MSAMHNRCRFGRGSTQVPPLVPGFAAGTTSDIAVDFDGGVVSAMG